MRRLERHILYIQDLTGGQNSGVAWGHLHNCTCKLSSCHIRSVALGITQLEI